MHPSSEVDPRPKWHAVWTRSHCEQLVFDQLVGRGFTPFLPKMRRFKSERAARPVEEPMFPGYLFVRSVLDKHAHVALLSMRGVVQVLGRRWDQLAEIPDHEMAAVQRLAISEQAVHAHPFLRQGERVRIHDGPLAGLEGILVYFRPGKHLVVVSVELLRRSVAVEVECDVVAAA